MKLVRSITELQINNLCRNEDCFAETVFVAEDIKLQIRIPNQVENDYTVAVNVFDTDFNDTGSLDFDYLIANDTDGNRYINIRAKTIPNESCFYLYVNILNGETSIFGKYTEQYRVREATVDCVAVFTEENPAIYVGGILQTELEKEFIDGLWVFYLPNCTDAVTSNDDFQLRKIITPSTGCGLNYKKIEGFYNCFDYVTEEFFGDYSEKLAGNPLLKHSKSFWLPVKIEKAPSEIKVNYINKQNRTTRSEITPLFDIRSQVVLPEWKANEFEEIFLAKEVYVDSIQYSFVGGNVLEKDSVPCSCSYIARARVQQSTKQNSFSCNDLCVRFCSFYVIPGGTKDQPYYNENGVFIGSLFSSLISYLQGLSGVVSVEDYSIMNLDCYPTAIIKINHTGYIPSYIYAGNRFTTSRVFSKRDDCFKPTTLCDGISTCLPSTITTGVPYSDGCAEVIYILGDAYEEGTGDALICNLVVLDSWVDNGSSSSIIGQDVTLVLKVTGTPGAYFEQPVARIGGGGDCGEFDPGDFDSTEFDAGCEVSCRPCTTQFINIGDGNSIKIQPDGYILFSGTNTPDGVVDYTVTYNKNC
jgi:hypothetical protein